MNIPTIDGLRYGAVLSTPASPTARLIARSRAARAYDAGFIANDVLHSAPHHKPHTTKSPWTPVRHSSLLSAVVPVGGRRFLNYFTSYPPSLRNSNHSTAEASEDSEQSIAARRREECLKFVDYYDDSASVDEQFRAYTDPYARRYAPSNGPNIRISNRYEDIELQVIDGDQRYREEKYKPARHLLQALMTRRRHPALMSLDVIWELYQALPRPRMSHISAVTRSSLMGALGSTEHKDEKSMLRYFSVVADTRNAGFALSAAQWNTAMSFAARYVAKTTEVELEAALNLWRSMEAEVGVKADDVTFNILFDAATKAGKFGLAEMIYTEMTLRGFPFNRYHYVSLIYFFGLKSDSSGVRAGYKELVEAGEIVDTVILNSLIASFIRCGEEHSAEHVYKKMRENSEALRVMPHRDYNMSSAITKILLMFARVGKQYPSLLTGFQKTALRSPDLSTYRILLNHYGPRLGDLPKVAQFLDEMKWCKVPLNGAIFLALFKAFAIHGGSGSDWTAERLHNVWVAFLSALDAGVEGLYISTWLAEAILEAHARYLNRNELMGIYELMRSRWELEPSGADYMVHVLRKLLEKGVPTSVAPWKRYSV